MRTIAYMVIAVAGMCGCAMANSQEGSTISSAVSIIGKRTEGRGQYQAFPKIGYRRIFLDVIENGEPSGRQEEIILSESLGDLPEPDKLIVITGERHSRIAPVKGNSGMTYCDSKIYAASWKYVAKNAPQPSAPANEASPRR